MCIYCRIDKREDEFTLEHVISQFLGGSQAPDYLKTRNVCRTCNSNLGLFVDASFEKDFLVFNELNEAAYSFFDPDNPTPLPLRNMGISDLSPPDMEEGEVCESWIGPLGEQIYWIRPSDERMYWYSGGNPRTVKKLRTRAYFMWSERSQKNPLITWLSFGDAFNGRKVRKVSCTRVSGANLADIGFSEPDELDLRRMEYFNERCSKGQKRNNRLSMYLRYDVRFMAKLAIGLGHVLFGEKFDNSNYTNELHKALWYKEEDPDPRIVGQSNLGQTNDFLKKECGIKHGVTITLLPSSKYLVLNLNISRKMNWVIGITEIENVKECIGIDLEHGLCVVLFKTLGRGISLSLPELIAHNSNNIPHPELVQVENLSKRGADYFEKL
ncbi:HNH endonuclease [Acinetobacter tibetensis]|uniref:HNH endonuclease n=1 Tax=Acinetobacter tibetensis TaxID=2943497 RepID=A0AAE9LU06_9GAMM|nr:HNH endonuclease [Acinetobacter tibetensis]USE84782.1 HNH endonuclease [Acinetobacter tibetensis]